MRYYLCTNSILCCLGSSFVLASPVLGLCPPGMTGVPKDKCFGAALKADDSRAQESTLLSTNVASCNLKQGSWNYKPCGCHVNNRSHAGQRMQINFNDCIDVDIKTGKSSFTGQLVCEQTVGIAAVRPGVGT